MDGGAGNDPAQQSRLQRHERLCVPADGTEQEEQEVKKKSKGIMGASHIPMPGMSKRDQEVYNHSVQSAQIAMIASAISMNDVWGWGATVQERIELETTKVTEEYNKHGFDWLLGEMEKIGFLVVDGEVRGFLGENNQAVTPKRARKEGYEGA
jgi:hypothetical protein